MLCTDSRKARMARRVHDDHAGVGSRGGSRGVAFGALVRGTVLALAGHAGGAGRFPVAQLRVMSERDMEGVGGEERGGVGVQQVRCVER